MSHFEGPIVDSFYEIALQSWYNRLSPPLPFIGTPYQPPRDENGNIRYLFADRNPYFDDIEVVKAAKAARQLLRDQTKDTDLERDAERQTFTEAVRRKIDQQRASFATWAPGEQLDMRAQQAMRDLREFRDKWSWNPSRAGSRAPSRRPSFSETNMRNEMAEDRIGEESRIREQSEARSSPTMVGGDVPLPKSKTYPDPASDHNTHALNQPQVAFAGLSDPSRERDGPIETDKEHQDEASVEGPSDPFKRVAPATVIFTEQGGVREGPAHVPEQVPTIVASPSASMVDVRATEPDLAQHATVQRLREEAGGKNLHVPDDGDKDQPRPSGESEVRPEGTGTKRMFQLSKRFSMSPSQSRKTPYANCQMLVHCQTHGQQWKIRTSLIISDLMSFTPHTILYLSPCVVENPTVSQVIMISGIRRMQLGSLDSGMRKRRSLCMSPIRHLEIRLIGSQSPTLNARPIVRAIKQTCRRGVEVVLFLDLGTSLDP